MAKICKKIILNKKRTIVIIVVKCNSCKMTTIIRGDNLYENYEIITKKKRDFFNKKLIDVNISFMEGLMISYAGNKPDQNQETLASLSGVDKYRTAKFLSSMEERGLIVRKATPENKREKLVALSEDGKEIYEKFNKWSEEWRELCFKDFNKDEINIFMGLLDKMIKNLE